MMPSRLNARMRSSTVPPPRSPAERAITSDVNQPHTHNPGRGRVLAGCRPVGGVEASPVGRVLPALASSGCASRSSFVSLRSAHVGDPNVPVSLRDPELVLACLTEKRRDRGGLPRAHPTPRRVRMRMPSGSARRREPAGPCWPRPFRLMAVVCRPRSGLPYQLLSLRAGFDVASLGVEERPSRTGIFPFPRWSRAAQGDGRVRVRVLSVLSVRGIGASSNLLDDGQRVRRRIGGRRSRRW